MDNYMKGGLIAVLFVALVLATKKVYSMTTNKLAGVLDGIPTPDEYNRLNNRKVSDVLTVRSNNPGAIFFFGDDWQGLDKQKSILGRIAYFTTVDYGVRAHVKTLWTYWNKHDLKTVSSIITRYAPPGVHNNATDNYIKFVCDFLKVDRDQTLNFKNDRDLYARFAWAQHIVEAGFAWVKFEQYLNWTKQMV